MMRDEATRKAFHRLRELSRDPVTAPYLVGYLLQHLDDRQYAALVEAALVYRDGVVAFGNSAGEAADHSHLTEAGFTSGIVDGGNDLSQKLLRERFS